MTARLPRALHRRSDDRTMRFSVDPWDPSYGTSLDTELGASTAEVALDAELAVQRWQPLDPTPGVEAPPTVLFVDGVRRIDAQVWVRRRRRCARPTRPG